MNEKYLRRLRKIIRKELLQCENIETADVGIISETILMEHFRAPEKEDDLINESLVFDKFVNDLEERDTANTAKFFKNQLDEDSPQREYNKRYREDWRNSTRFT